MAIPLYVTRTQTIMQGASHCDFRYALEKRESDLGRSKYRR